MIFRHRYISVRKKFYGFFEPIQRFCFFLWLHSNSISDEWSQEAKKEKLIKWNRTLLQSQWASEKAVVGRKLCDGKIGHASSRPKDSWEQLPPLLMPLPPVLPLNDKIMIHSNDSDSTPRMFPRELEKQHKSVYEYKNNSFLLDTSIEY